jgi:amino acid transporter
MHDSTSLMRRLAERSVLEKLGASYLAAIVALAGAIWFELPRWIASALLVVALVLTVLLTVSAGQVVARWRASFDYRKRPAITGRDAGMLTLVVLGLIPFAIWKFVYPRSWPTNVQDAVAMVSAQLDAESARNLAYMGYDDLASLQSTLGASLRDQFGLNTRNFRLAYDCDAEYMHPHTCSAIIISRLWKKVRADLPAAERESLETLESGMDRVRFESEKFENVSLQELAAFFNDAIRAQLGPDARLKVVHDPARANDMLSVAWRAMGTISLREALSVLADGGEWRARKEPPNLVIERSAS